MATKAEVRNKVLHKLRVLPLGYTADSDQASKVEDTYDEVYESLLDDGVVDWGSSDDIPSESVRPIVSIVAAEVADEFGIPEARIQRLNQEAYGPDVGERECALTKLRNMVAGEYQGTPTQVDYY